MGNLLCGSARILERSSHHLSPCHNSVLAARCLRRRNSLSRLAGLTALHGPFLDEGLGSIPVVIPRRVERSCHHVILCSWFTTAGSGRALDEGGSEMARKRHTPEEIIGEAERYLMVA